VWWKKVSKKGGVRITARNNNTSTAEIGYRILTPIQHEICISSNPIMSMALAKTYTEAEEGRKIRFHGDLEYRVANNVHDLYGGKYAASAP
jgi:hypothetical protein